MRTKLATHITHVIIEGDAFDLKKIRATRWAEVEKEWLVFKLLKELIAAYKARALEIAWTLCVLIYPDRYTNEVMSIRFADDVRKLLADRGLHFVTYTGRKRLGRLKYSIEARISRALPLEIAGKRVVLDSTPSLLEAKQFEILVSGPGVIAGSIQSSPADMRDGDLFAQNICVEFSAGECHQRVLVDFIADNRHLRRDEIVFYAD